MGIKNDKGITLIELILSLALMGVILVAGYNFLSVGLDSFNGQAANIDNQSKARQALGSISREIRRADSLIIHNNTSIELDKVVYRFEKDSNSLLRNDSDFVTKIESFNVKEDDGRILLEIGTLSDTGEKIKLSTSIYIRE